MKKINNLIKMLVFCGAIVFTSCETTNLDLAKNPNALATEQGDVDFYLNSIQISFAGFVESWGRTAGAVTRVDYMNGRDYANAYSPTAFDGRWRSAYSGMFIDIKNMKALAQQNGLVHHMAIAQVIEAYTLLTLVDMFGEVPYSEAISGSDNLNPNADKGDVNYAVAISLLDDAITKFGATLSSSSEPKNDFFYDGDWAKWAKAANTIKMKALLATRLVDASAVGKFNAIVTSGNYITANADDFQFKWGTNETLPDSRHPRYSNSYTTTGGGDYMSNSLMNYMRGNGWFGTHFDPRIMFYFYRQSNATPGIDGAPADEETLECGLQNPPAHYTGHVFCGVPNGWWGRDHGNDNGIPPDGFLRTLAGVYPAGGKLDDWSYGGQKNGAGNGGNGITPIMLASWVDFMRAEVALAVNTDAATAKTLMSSGMAKSMDKVTTFSPLTTRFVGVTDFNFGGLSGMIARFNASIDADWAAAANDDERMNILAKQYFVSTYGNSIDAYNFYRRTGFPRDLQPNIEPSPGTFIRSFFYPAAYANTNSNATQKSGVNVQVFWDNNPASPAFPVAN